MPCFISTGGHLLEFRSFPSRFGTASDNEIVIQEGFGVAPHHFTLRREGVRTVLESTGQAATTVNGNDVRKATIGDGDRIQVGQLMLIYSNPSGQESPYARSSGLPASKPATQPTTVSARVSGQTERVTETLTGFSALKENPFGEGAPPRPITQPVPVPDGNARPDPATETTRQVRTPFDSNGSLAAAARNQAVPQPETTPPKVEKPVEEAVDVSAIFGGDESDSEKDLASVFQDSGDASPTDPVDVEIPAIPDITEAEKSGAVAEAELPSQDINPIGSLINRKRPTAPPPSVPKASTVDESTSRRSQKKKPRKQTSKTKVRSKASDDPVATRLGRQKSKPKYDLIPWHKIALFCCLIFAAAGAYLATEGQPYVDKYLKLLGIKRSSGHLENFAAVAATEPNFVLTFDAKRVVGHYRKWAVDEEWKTVGEIEALLKTAATSLRLSELERVTVALDDSGEFVTMVSLTTDLNRQTLMRDLGRGILTSERVGALSVSEGFIGKSRAIRFAVINPKLVVLGDPNITMRLVRAITDPTTISIEKESALKQLVPSGQEWFGWYHRQGALAHVKAALPNAYASHIDRMMGWLRSAESDDGEFFVSIGNALHVQSHLQFATAGEAERFSKAWSESAKGKFQEVMAALGTHAPQFREAEQDLNRVVVSTQGEIAEVSLAVPNRWANNSSTVLKSKLVQLAEAFQKEPTNHTPALMTPEEMRARQLARQVEHQYAEALRAGAKALGGVKDPTAIVELLQKGVNGSSPYHNIVYRVGKADEEVTARALELLEWRQDELVMVIKAPSADRNEPTMVADEAADDL